jgi:phage tail-like protein
MGLRTRAPERRRRILMSAILFLLAALNQPAGPAAADAIAFEPAPPLMYRVEWDGHEIPGIFRISGLARRTEVVDDHDGGESNGLRRSPGISRYEPLVLDRFLGAGPEFEQWATKVWSYGTGFGSEVSLRDFRKDLRIVLYNALGETVMVYRVYRCWPSDYRVMGEMKAEAPSAPVETLVLQYEGWERDHEVVPRVGG